MIRSFLIFDLRDLSVLYMRNNTIVRRLILYFLFLNILTVITVGSYSYFRAKDALVKRTYDQLTSLRIEKSNGIERFFNERAQDIRLVSEADDVRNIITILDDGKAIKDQDKMLISSEYSKFLRMHFQSGNYYNDFYLINNQGLIASFSVSDHLDDHLELEMIENSQLYKLYESVIKNKSVILEDFQRDIITNLPVIYMGIPIWSQQNQLIGIAAVSINVDKINSIMFEDILHNGLGKSGESYLVGEDLLMRSTSRFQNNSVFQTEVSTLASAHALDGKTGTKVIADYRGVKVLSSYSSMQLYGLTWAVLAEIDEREAMIPIYSIRNNIIYISVLITMLLFVLVYLIAKRISQPIEKLKEATDKIIDGDYDVTVERMKGSVEIINLVDAFNEMSQKIKEQTENLKLERSMRLSSMIDGQEIERQRLSRELHDGLGQSILAIRLRLDRMEAAEPQRAKEIMSEVQELIADTIHEVRSISNNLMPAVLNDFGLKDALKNLCAELSELAMLNITYHCDLKGKKLSDKQSTYLYRIAQEGLNNVIKHSKAANASITMSSDRKNILVTIEDDGEGFNYYEGKKMCGNGLSNMKDRVNLLYGEISIHSRLRKGTKIEISIPTES